jgi:hypothetical protein
MFVFFVSCASAPKPQAGDIVEGKIVRIVNGFSRRMEKKSTGQKFSEWLFGVPSNGGFNYIKDKTGKLYFVQVSKEGRKDQRKFFLPDDYVEEFNFKIGDNVKYEIKYITPEHLISPSYYHVATTLVFLDKNDVSQSLQNTPPPLGTGEKYNVVINEQNNGPYDIAELRRMAQRGELTKDTLAWKEGMADWAEAGTIEALKGLFGTSNPPPIPKK